MKSYEKGRSKFISSNNKNTIINIINNCNNSITSNTTTNVNKHCHRSELGKRRI